MIILFTLFLSITTYANIQKIDGILATVNNELILLSDLNDLKNKNSKSSFLDELPLGLINPEELKTSHEMQIEYLVRAAMLDAEVSRLNLNVTFSRVDQEIKDLAKRNNLNREQYIKEIEQLGLKFSDYQDYFKKRLERQQFVDMEILSKVKVSDEDLLSAYTVKFGKSPNSSFEVELSHIFFNPQKGSSKEAYSRAEECLDRIKKGQSFDSLVLQFSEDINLQNSGNLGWFKKSDLDLALAQNIESMSGLGVLEKVIKSKTGYHIFKVIQKKDIYDQDFLKKKTQIQSELIEKLMRNSIEKWFELNKKNFTIHIKK